MQHGYRRHGRSPDFFQEWAILRNHGLGPMPFEIPQTWIERAPFLESFHEPWRPLPRWASGAWLAFYALFLFQLARGGGLFR